MPTKQKPRSRTWRQGRIPPEAIALFVELEHCSQRGPKFNAKARELARMLGLVSEWWSGQSVLDRSPAPCHPPGHIARDDFYRCRVVRQQLLTAIRQRGAPAA